MKMILYFIRDHEGKTHGYSEKELRDKIMEDNDRDYYDWSSPVAEVPIISWCAPVTEIAQVIDKLSSPSFRDDICRTVLNRCMYFHKSGHIFKKVDQDAIWKCFLRLSSGTDQNCELRANYIDCYIEHVVIYGLSAWTNHSGEKWQKFCQDFRKEIGDEWKDIYQIGEISNWALKVQEDFSRRLKKAEDSKAFEEEDEENFTAFLKSFESAYSRSLPYV